MSKRDTSVTGPAPAASKRARAVLEATLKRRESEHVAYIHGACGDDEALREEVTALLDAGETAKVVLDRADVIVEAALERRRTERLAFVEGARGVDEDLKARLLAILTASEASANPAVRIIKPPAEPVVVEPAPSPPSADDEATRIAPPASLRSAEPPLQTSPGPSFTWQPGQPMEGRRIGPYQLLYSLGKGSMGSVYAASRADQE